MNSEQCVFFGIAKTVRQEMDFRKNNGWGSRSKINAFIHVSTDACITNAKYLSNFTLSQRQFWAIFYKLQDKGLVKLHSGHRRKLTKFSLDTKGVEYLKQLKLRKMEVS